MDVVVFDVIAQYCDVPELVMLAMTCRTAEIAVVGWNRASHRFVSVSAIHNATLHKCLYIVSKYTEYHSSIIFVDRLFIAKSGYAYHATDQIGIYENQSTLRKDAMPVSFEKLVSDAKRIIITHSAPGIVDVCYMTSGSIRAGTMDGNIILSPSPQHR